MNGSSARRSTGIVSSAASGWSAGSDGDERLDAEALDDQVGVVDGRAQQRDVQRSVEQALDLRGREHLAPQVEADARQLRAQRLGECAAAASRSSSR